MKDFEPIALISTQPVLIVARKTMPANERRIPSYIFRLAERLRLRLGPAESSRQHDILSLVGAERC